MGKIALCADSESLIRPELLLLNDVDLTQTAWIDTFFKADDIRREVRARDDIDAVWIFAADDMDAINIAAALHEDKPQIALTCILPHVSGSVMSRASSAGVTEVLEPHEFALVFAREMAMRSPLTCASLRNTPTSNPALTANELCDKQALPAWLSNRSEAPVEQSAFVLSAVSGSGGVGKSSFIALCAIDAVQRGLNTLLLDCDLQFGDMHSMLGMSDPVTIDELLGDPQSLQKALVQAGSDLPVLVGAPKRIEYGESIISSIGPLIDFLSETFDVIFINTGSNWSEHHAVILEKSSCALFLIDQRASSVRACQHAVDLCMRMGIATRSFVYALNKCARKAAFTALDIASVMQGAHVFELADGGSEVEELCGSGKARALFDSTNPFRESVTAVLDELLPALPTSTCLPEGVGQNLLERWERRIARGNPRRRSPRNISSSTSHKDTKATSRHARGFQFPKGVPQMEQAAGTKEMPL